MKKKIFYLVLIILSILVGLIYSFSFKEYDYNLIILNQDNKKIITAPEKIFFKPHSTKQIIDYYKNTNYNFGYYIDWNFLIIDDHTITLSLKE